jgi:hypothetical protein
MFAAMFAPRPLMAAAEMKPVSRPSGLIAMANWTCDGFVGEQDQIMMKHVPLPPPALQSPVLWGGEAVVRERLGSGLALSMTKGMLTFDIAIPRETEADFRPFGGFTKIVFAQLDTELGKPLLYIGDGRELGAAQPGR